MLANLTPFLLHWAITATSLWVASHLFKGMRFGSTSALVVSALLLGLANAVVRPLLVFLTLPLTLLSFGLFLLVINALMLLLVSALVRGFTISGFWTAFVAALFIGFLSFVLGLFVDTAEPAPPRPAASGRWVQSATPGPHASAAERAYASGRSALPG